MKKNVGHFEYAYAQTSQSAIRHGVDHLVCLVSKSAKWSQEKLGHAVSAGRKSISIVTDAQGLSHLWSDGPPERVGLDVGDIEVSAPVRDRARDFMRVAREKMFGMKAPEREVDRVM